MGFNKLEQRIIDIAVKRYNSSFFRWGHLLGWLALPVCALMLLPTFKPYAKWLTYLVMLLFFHWHYVLTTRVIGKLKAELDAQAAGAQSS